MKSTIKPHTMSNSCRRTTHSVPFLALLTLAVSLSSVAGSANAQLAEDDPRHPADNQGPALLMPANPKLPTLFLIGDSTVRNGHGDGANGQWGWGEPLVDYFDAAKINVVNRALGGRSSRTYLTQGYWEQVKAILKRGDFVMIQFGHNDSSPLDDTARARGTLPGVGDETREIENPITMQHEVVHTFGWYMKKFVADIRAAGATPIICSPIPRRTWKDGKIVRNSQDYGGWAAAVATSGGALFIDLNEIIARRYDDLGPENVELLFRDADTHTGRAGAELNAECVIAGLKRLEPNPLAPYFLPAAVAGTLAPKPNFNFDFGSGKARPGYILVTPTTTYTDALGYGFEPGSTVQVVDRIGESLKHESLKSSFVTSSKPFYFSVKVPEEGNYRVTVMLGDADAASTTTVKAELRRLMLARVQTSPGKFETRGFIVNIRRPTVVPGEEVHLKPREKTSEAWAWDDKLTLEFADSQPALCSLEIEKDDAVPTLYIAGDSTSTDQPLEPYNSWGQMLPVFFRPQIAIANHGESGESLRSFIKENRFDKLATIIKPGDWLLIQMGHNDQKETGEGVGAFTNFKTDLKLFVAMAREHGATPVLITPMNRLVFNPAGKITSTLGDYPEAVRQEAREDNVALIDLQPMSTKFYETLGPHDGRKAFSVSPDISHHNDYGSYELAKCIVQGIKDDQLPLARYLYPTPEFDPAKPDPFDTFDIPAEPLPGAVLTPYGH
jgi:lysophospholipase L1-like esterase